MFPMEELATDTGTQAEGPGRPFIIILGGTMIIVGEDS